MNQQVSILVYRRSVPPFQKTGKMNVTRRSPFSGKTNTRFIRGLTEEMMNRYRAGEYPIQNIMPNISPEDREFIMTGITPEEWKEAFGQIEL